MCISQADMLRPQRGHLGKLYVAFQGSFSQLPARNIGLFRWNGCLPSVFVTSLSLCAWQLRNSQMYSIYYARLRVTEPVIYVTKSAKQRDTVSLAGILKWRLIAIQMFINIYVNMYSSKSYLFSTLSCNTRHCITGISIYQWPIILMYFKIVVCRNSWKMLTFLFWPTAYDVFLCVHLQYVHTLDTCVTIHTHVWK